MQVSQPPDSPRRTALYTETVEDCAKTLRDAIYAITAVTDRTERAKAATEMLEAIGSANNILSAMRREDIKALREAGMSYRQIGTAIGVHFTRVKQIESGLPMGNSARSRAERKTATA
jgi:DNA-directed RNA polymerase specialized sigma24 family protein